MDGKKPWKQKTLFTAVWIEIEEYFLLENILFRTLKLVDIAGKK